MFTVDTAGGVELSVTGLSWRTEVCQQVFEEAAVDLGKGLKAWSDSRSGKRKGKRIGFLGLAFKPNTDDVRDSPALDIIEILLHEGAVVRAFDPAAMATTRAVLGDRIEYADDTYDAVTDADVLVIATEWNQFRNLDLGRLRDLMKRPVIVDLRNVYSPDRMREQGFHYTSVGR